MLTISDLYSKPQIIGRESAIVPLSAAEMEVGPTLDDVRVRFNWGFWEGRAHAKRRADAMPIFWEKGKHFDPVYESGFWYGVDAAKCADENVGSSAPAFWLYQEQLAFDASFDDMADDWPDDAWQN